jgi:NAD(P)-dependent dehydrogenase (short-subunit alcohol dehydrogenase family)
VTSNPHPPQRASAWAEDVTVIAEGTLDGCCAIVTGAGTGIGRDITRRLVSLGADVVGLGRRAELLDETGTLVAALRGSYRWRSVDLRDAEAARAVVAEVSTAGLDLLVNNAGGQFYAALADISDNGFRAVVDLNLNAVFTMISAAQPLLARKGGTIVNISLSGVDRGGAGIGHSIAARAGVLALTRTIALEWAHLGIRANCIGPGAVLTPGLPESVQKTLRDITIPESVPAGRATPTEDIAELVAFLACPAGRMITGQMLHVDGAAHLGRGLHMLDDWPPLEN